MLRRSKRKRVNRFPLARVRTWWEIRKFQMDQPLSWSFLYSISNEKINRMIQQDDRLWLKVTLAISTLLHAPTDLVKLIASYWVENPLVLPQRGYTRQTLPIKWARWSFHSELFAGNLHFRETVVHLDFHFSNLDFDKVRNCSYTHRGDSRLLFLFYPKGSKPSVMQVDREQYVVEQSKRNMLVLKSFPAEKECFQCQRFSEICAYMESTPSPRRVLLYFVHALDE